MRKNNLDFEMEELSVQEKLIVNGGEGESAWYWIAYGIGAGARAVADYFDVSPNAGSVNWSAAARIN
jgi:hypothetical protein